MKWLWWHRTSLETMTTERDEWRNLYEQASAQANDALAELRRANDRANELRVAHDMELARADRNGEAAERAIAAAEATGRELEQAKAVVEAWKTHAERADARFDALWQKYLDATRPPEPKAVVAQTYRSDEQAVRVVEDGFVKKLTADLKAKGIPDAVAQMEATRIRRETTRVGA